MTDADLLTLDAIGLLCPLPVLKARKRLEKLKPGDVLRVEVDDPAALVDIPHFCVESGHTLLDQSEEMRQVNMADRQVQIYLIQKAAPAK
ncbi:MAG: sulfurtransferase TusA family protein [Pseudomonadota bacterium]